ncbi:MAG: hypothetical protein ABR577_18910 [Pyrinomonadaceae bacterium]
MPTSGAAAVAVSASLALPRLRAWLRCAVNMASAVIAAMIESEAIIARME